VAMFTIPAYTALVELTGLKLNYHPQLVVSNVGTDPTTLIGLLKAFSKGKAPSSLIDGVVTDGYLPPTADTSNSWIKLFKQIHDQYIAKLPFDGNVEYGFGVAYTFAEALAKAGKNPTRQSIVNAVETGNLSGPGLVPFRYAKGNHSGYTGTQIGVIKSGAIKLQGSPQTTDDAGGAISNAGGGQTQAPANGIPSG
jgi:hypothetical protein